MLSSITSPLTRHGHLDALTENGDALHHEADVGQALLQEDGNAVGARRGITSSRNAFKRDAVPLILFDLKVTIGLEVKGMEGAELDKLERRLDRELTAEAGVPCSLRYCVP